MPKIKFSEIKKSGVGEGLSARRFYESKYFGLFLDAYEFTNISEEQKHFLLKKMWKQGTCAALILEGTKPDASLKQLLSNSSADTLQVDAPENPNGLLVFCGYAPCSWNANDWPSTLTLVNHRGTTFIPTDIKKVNIDVVIGYAHTSHGSIRDMVLYYIDRICEVEDTIETQLFTHKLPRLIICSPEDRKRVEDIVEAIERGEHKLFLDVNDWQAIKNVLDSGGAYIIDKLYQYKQNLENELLTFLGINNVAIQKQERLIVDEANANNEVINESSDCFLDSLKAFCKRISEVLDYPIDVKAKFSAPVIQAEEQAEEDSEMEDEEDVD